MNFYQFIRPIIFTLPEEAAHHLALSVLQKGLLPTPREKQYLGTLRMDLWGLSFKNPVGLAAGFDKNAVAIKPLLDQGFGFIETGTVTPLPQIGNEKPRLFRLKEDKAIINRMGMPGDGSDLYVKRLEAWQKYKSTFGYKGIVGANIGKNKEGDAKEDYITMLKKVYGLSDYISLNISSPNTAGLRDLQAKDELEKLLSALKREKKMLMEEKDKDIPILLKIAPDLGEDEQKDIAEVMMKQKIDGLIVSNTTTARENLKSKNAGETGGLSGKPLLEPSTKVLKNMYKYTEGKVPIVGLGGVFTAEDAYAKIKAGASLIQIYTSLIYKGFYVIDEINTGLEKLLFKDGYSHLSEAVGKDAGS